MTAEIIAVGSELLTPHRTDTNSLFLTAQLNRLGIDVAYKTIVGDDRARLAETIGLAWKRSALVVTIGGLGPTEDDLTRECAASALGRSLSEDPALAKQIEARFRARGIRMPEINLRQAWRIEGATILDNPKGTAPGQWIRADGKILILLPGPPRELETMFLESCLERLRETVPPAAIAQRVLKITGRTESAVEEIAAPIYTRYTNPVTTILAAPGDVQLHVKSFAEKQSAAEALADELAAQLERAIGNAVFSNDGANMEQVAGRLLEDAHATLAVAESCTGGMLAQRITAVPGSSAYFLGGVVCYSNAVKESWLGVSADVLASNGAVSAPVAQALAEGIRGRLNSTYGLGITGIAGPDGGTKEKPVGTVFISLAAPEGSQVVEKHYWGERDIVRWQATQTALDLLRRALQQTSSSAKAES